MRSKIIIACGVSIAILVAIWFGSSPAPDRRRVDPALLSLVPPFTTFATLYYMDGGSIGVRLVDSRGQAQSFALPVDNDHTYPRLFVGATHTNNSGAVEIPFGIDTRRMPISWIEANRTSNDSSDLALLHLRGSSRDYARIGGRAVTNLSNALLR